MKTRNLYIVFGGIAAILVGAGLLLALMPHQTGQKNPNTGGSFGSPNTTTVGTSQNPAGSSNEAQTVTQISQQKIFKISNGPVAGATFIQTFHPTTTVARFVMADNGHIFDFTVDSPGAVARTVSNTTIPGALSSVWVGQGSGTILQYLSGTTPKTVYLGLPASSTAPVRLQFYPDGIYSLAASPDGQQVAYLLRSATGVDGYLAKVDGTGGKKLFSLPLTQVQLRWPAPGTLLAYSNSAAGVPGIAFTIAAQSGVVTPLVYGPGLTATASRDFSAVLYQTITAAGTRMTYTHSVATGADHPISFSPFPEQCIQHPLSPNMLYCAAPLAYVGPDFLDLQHQGAASAADSLLSFNLTSGTSTIVATPGGAEGGIPTDMLSIGLSPDGHYALFVSQFDRSLWGVRLKP